MHSKIIFYFFMKKSILTYVCIMMFTGVILPISASSVRISFRRSPCYSCYYPSHSTLFWQNSACWDCDDCWGSGDCSEAFIVLGAILALAVAAEVIGGCISRLCKSFKSHVKKNRISRWRGYYHQPMARIHPIAPLGGGFI